MINPSDEDHLVSGRALFSYQMADYRALPQRWMGWERAHAGIIVAPQQHDSAGEELR